MTSLARDIWGQSYWVVERGESTLGEPQEIWWVKPTQMRPIPHPELYISHYEFDPLSGGEPIPFLPWEVVRIYNPNPIDEFKALSALSSTSIYADHEKDSMEANMNLHRMGLNPGAIVTPKGGMLWEPGQAREIEDDINKRLGGVDQAHRWGTFRQEVDIHKTSVTPRDSEFLGGMSYDLEAVARAYDWPIDLLAGKRTYENVEMAFKRAWQTTIMSAAAFSADIAEFYLPMFGTNEILVPYFDATNIAVLQETESIKWERESSQIDVVVSRNEWRVGRGLPPKEGGDELYISTQQVPLSAVAALGSAVDPFAMDPLALEEVDWTKWQFRRTSMKRTSRVVIDDRRFLSIDGIKVCRVTRDGRLEFKDKDGRRSRMRGSAYVTVNAEQITRAIHTIPAENLHDNGSSRTRRTDWQHQYDIPRIHPDNKGQENGPAQSQTSAGNHAPEGSTGELAGRSQNTASDTKHGTTNSDNKTGTETKSPPAG
jgi:hypothetical protein